jgi:hypothetical protein
MYTTISTKRLDEVQKKSPETFVPGFLYINTENQFPSTAIWLIADIIAPATVR